VRTVSLNRALTLTLLSAIAAASLCACNEDKNNNSGLTSTYDGRSLSVIGSIRPKADPNMVAKIRQEEQESREKLIAAQQAAERAAAAKLQQQNAMANPANRDLPEVDQNPISGIANAFGFGGGNQENSIQNSPMMNSAPPPPATATYGGYGGAAGLIPPPPVVSLSTQASPAYPAVPDGYSGYPGGYGYPPPAAPYPYMQPPTAHLPGSMFSNRDQAPTIRGDDDEPKRKSIVVITPTGMEARSNYKQRDDLRLLVKAAFANSPQRELHEPKVASALAMADVKLPGSSSKGNISLSQRDIDNLINTPRVDEKAMPAVRKIEGDLTQAYYRYLYSFNRYTLTQQQVAARKQEVDVADSNSEKQRAAADLSSTETDADSAKDDLHSAQNDLASIAGVQAARTVIQKVTGVAPSMDSLAVDNPAPQGGGRRDSGLLGSMRSVFSKGNDKVAKANDDNDKAEKRERREKPEKHNKADKKGKDRHSKTDNAPEVASADEDEQPAQTASSAPAPSPAAAAGGSNSGISFELKNIQTTPRKSVLKVAIRNNTDDSLSIDPDNISVAEGDHKLADAAFRSDFDSTLVEPNHEVSGTITIFGRPWNDRLTVSLSDGGKKVTLHR
jgi:hypothetical protein